MKNGHIFYNHIILLFLFALFLFSTFANAQTGKYKFKVIFQDGHSEIIKSPIYYDAKIRKNYLRFKDASIYPDATDSILLVSSHTTITGYAFNNTWLFKVIDGDISCLTYLPDNINIIHGFLHKKGDTVLTHYSTKELVKMLNTKPRAHKYYKTLRNINRYTVLAGCVGFAGGIGIVFVNNPDVSIWGARTALLSIPLAIPVLVTMNYKIKAIRKYNSIKQ